MYKPYDGVEMHEAIRSGALKLAALIGRWQRDNTAQIPDLDPVLLRFEENVVETLLWDENDYVMPALRKAVQILYPPCTHNMLECDGVIITALRVIRRWRAEGDGAAEAKNFLLGIYDALMKQAA